ncbi:ABC transporter permease [Cupriavidus pinatubonensis]|uniref:Transport permease protein n=1 Tax=Cupriavidus pinatubonensis TaxID=248026 RepID=A0ABN7Z4X8_9BURK|nr:ABC transporter permease [Cupriavidus pinatubonensis]CAG9180213.1 Teichoic acid translocation permease protein TagG [Cupriavidus pinatubonensis]
MKTYSASPLALVRSLVANQGLILSLAHREAVGRYKGSILGIFWSLLTPLLMLAVYTFVFSEVFKARWNGGSNSKTEFAIVLFAGMIIFNLFAECIGKAPSIILSNANFVKKVIFPLEILPCVNLLSALFHAGVSMAILLVFELVEAGSVPATVWQIPLVLLPLSALILGLSWWLAATSVYLRDVGQTIGILITALMFLSPVFFPVSSLPPSWQTVAHLNPLSFPIEQARNVLVWGQSISWWGLCLYTLVTFAVAWIGFAWFQKARKGFADVL